MRMTKRYPPTIKDLGPSLIQVGILTRGTERALAFRVAATSREDVLTCTVPLDETEWCELGLLVADGADANGDNTITLHELVTIVRTLGDEHRSSVLHVSQRGARQVSRSGRLAALGHHPDYSVVSVLTLYEAGWEGMFTYVASGTTGNWLAEHQILFYERWPSKWDSRVRSFPCANAYVDLSAYAFFVEADALRLQGSVLPPPMSVGSRAEQPHGAWTAPSGTPSSDTPRSP